MSKAIFEKEFGYNRPEFLQKAQEIEDAGGIAWVEESYGLNMSGQREYMGLDFFYLTADMLRERLREAEAKAVPVRKDAATSVHATHCCPIHGCKYGGQWCPVTEGHEKPVYPANNGCESCEADRQTIYDVLYGGFTGPVVRAVLSATSAEIGQGGGFDEALIERVIARINNDRENAALGGDAA